MERAHEKIKDRAKGDAIAAWLSYAICNDLALTFTASPSPSDDDKANALKWYELALDSHTFVGGVTVLYDEDVQGREHAATQFNMGMLFKDMGRFEEAVNALEDAVVALNGADPLPEDLLIYRNNLCYCLIALSLEKNDESFRTRARTYLDEDWGLGQDNPHYLSTYAFLHCADGKSGWDEQQNSSLH